jgi:hypothetical protein
VLVFKCNINPTVLETFKSALQALSRVIAHLHSRAAIRNTFTALLLKLPRFVSRFHTERSEIERWLVSTGLHATVDYLVVNIGGSKRLFPIRALISLSSEMTIHDPASRLRPHERALRVHWLTYASLLLLD